MDGLDEIIEDIILLNNGDIDKINKTIRGEENNDTEENT